MFIILIVLVLMLPYIFQRFAKDNTKIKDTDKAIAQLSKVKYKDSVSNNTLSDAKLTNPIMFDFNPNNLPAEKWIALGLSEKQVAIIKHYEAKGGHFYKNTDVQKIYGITPDDYKRLEPYIDITDAVYVSNKLKPGATIELNTADSAKLTEVKGIGPGFAMRIIRYRGRLGGFYQKEQLKEVYGVDSVKYAEIKDQLTINPAAVSKVNINSISFESLRQFPYLNYKQASAVIEYRNQHGKYASIGDMKNIAILTPTDIHKIEPYIRFK
jgi:competence protein ComEA